LQEWITANGFDTTRVIYVGNGLNDLSCMEIAGCAVAVADAHPQVKARADIVLDHAGGSGALSELCELILEHNGLLQ
jgi:N-acylneuraminate cytidylyltransferase